MTTRPDLAAILDLARWAPSGDNTQPWRFEITAPDRLVVHGFDTRSHCVYDLDGHPSQISIGALLENIAIAASAQGLRAVAERLPAPDTEPTIEVRFEPAPGLAPDPLLPFVERRSVQRRPLSTKALATAQKAALEAAVGPGYGVLWLEGGAARRRAAALMFGYAKLRLTMPEAYETHRAVIEWNARTSADRVPDQALGIDPMTAKLMRRVLQSWERVAFFNRFLAGTWAPRLQMDLLPGLACAAHFVIHAERAPETVDDYLAAGRAVQRFWLTATQQGLQLQPEMTPLIFARYVREGRPFSRLPALHALASTLAGKLDALISPALAPRGVFMGRLGSGRPATARSVRLPVAALMHLPSIDRAPR